MKSRIITHTILKKFLLLSLACLSPSLLFPSTISGYVADAKTGETIIGVNVIVEGTVLGASTDINGFFVLSDIPDGDVILRFSHIAYEEKRQTIELRSRDILVSRLTLLFSGRCLSLVRMYLS